MALPILKLDLAPPSNLWRMNHGPLGWAALAAGGVLLAASLGFTWRAYAAAAAAGRQTVTLVAQTSQSAETERRVLSELRSVDVAKELPRWRLAEKIFTERSLPWSRLTAELERSLVADVRLKSIQRTRGTDMAVQLKLRGEARSRAAEAAFVESLQKNHFFEQVLLEREGERQGGGVDFEYTLAAQGTPPPFVPLPKQPKYASAKAPVPAPKPQPGRPAPAPFRAPAPMAQAAPALQKRVPVPVPNAVDMPISGPDRARQRRLELRGGRPLAPDGRGAPLEGRPNMPDGRSTPRQERP